MDLTTTELADELAGGVLSAGPTRLTAVGKAKIPQVVSLGALDMVNFGAPESIPEKYNYQKSTSTEVSEASSRSRRVFFQHNANITLMRTSVDECRSLGKEISKKLTEAHRNGARTAVIIPLQGWSGIDTTGGVFWDPEADSALVEELQRGLEGSNVIVKTLEGNINDESVAEQMVEQLHSLFGEEI